MRFHPGPSFNVDKTVPYLRENFKIISDKIANRAEYE
jgi:hypothetical protein